MDVVSSDPDSCCHKKSSGNRQGRRACVPREGMVLHLWKDAWHLDVQQCPCDVHFTDYLEKNNLVDQTIFHFGTGAHHHVGRHAALNSANNVVLGITATESEYEAYMRLTVENPQLGRHYKVIFGDVYQTIPELLPRFHIVTLFHLCEFWSAHNAPFATLDDAGLLDAMSARVLPGGLVAFYTGSFAFSAARPLIASWAAKGGFAFEGRHESLEIYRRRPDPVSV